MSRFMPTCKVFRAKVLYALNREIAMMFWLSDRAVLHQQYNLYAKFHLPWMWMVAGRFSHLRCQRTELHLDQDEWCAGMQSAQLESSGMSEGPHLAT